MMKPKKILMITAAVLTLLAAGCVKKKAEVIEVTPTPAPTATPTVAPATPTPAPTATPAPRMIGTKTSTSKFVYLTNNTNKDIREFYLRVSGAEEWGNNLVPSESSVKAAEQVQLYYSPSGSAEQSTGETENTQSAASAYDLKLVDRDGNAYEISGAQLTDMEKATIRYEDEEDMLYLSYMSVSEKKEKDTKNSSSASSSDSDENDSDSDDSSYSSDYDYDYDNNYSSYSNSYDYNDYSSGNSDYSNNYDDYSGGTDYTDDYYDDGTDYSGDDYGEDVVWDEYGNQE